MGFLDIKEQWTRHRILTGRNSFRRRRDAAHCRHFQLVLVVLEKRQTKDADTVRIGVDACQSFGIIAVDINRATILTHIKTCIFSIIFRHASSHHGFHGTGDLTSFQQHFVLENFSSSVLCAGNKGHDVSSWKLRVEVRPLLMRIFNNRAVHENFGAERIENIHGLERAISRSIDLAGKHDTIISNAHFDDLCHTGFGAGFDFFFADRTGRISNVDRVLTNAFTKALET